MVKTEEEIIHEIQDCLNNSCQIKDEYRNRIKDTFIHLDYNNSERVFRKILELDKDESIDYRFNHVH